MERKHFHLIGIGGSAMASLAGLLKAAGHEVTGSDSGVYPPMSTQLETLGIACAEGYRPENLRPRPDVVVVGNAISRGNPELEAVLDGRLHYTSAAAVLREEFIRGRHSLAVAGTHGKTTTTSLLAWILDVAGYAPSFLVGGVVENFGTSFRLTDSGYFVIEADEYDTAYFDKSPKMWHYLPDTAVVGNMEFDHADIYRDEEAYRFAFSRFINLIPARGTLVAGWESGPVRELAARSFAPVESFALLEPDVDQDASASDARWLASGVEYGPRGSRFDVHHDGVRWGSVETPLVGAFNVRNCLAAIAAATSVGVPPDPVQDALRRFRSVRRRLEVRGEPRGITVLDDFAHHPTAVRETIRAVRQRYPGRRLIALFEPRSFTAQRREFQEPYRQALSGADEVILAGLFHPERYTAESALDPLQLAADLTQRGVPARHIENPDAIVRDLAPRLEPGDIVLIMSNGSFGGIHGELLSELSSR
jgi:UDP-N-acetylmuramate: L-alanyl-gamma-D-glutamyl-meso-diaminopimelate ligase